MYYLLHLLFQFQSFLTEEVPPLFLLMVLWRNIITRYLTYVQYFIIFITIFYLHLKYDGMPFCILNISKFPYYFPALIMTFVFIFSICYCLPIYSNCPGTYSTPSGNWSSTTPFLRCYLSLYYAP